MIHRIFFCLRTSRHILIIKMATNYLTTYMKRLSSIPAPGGGCHPTLLGVANLGVMAGFTPERIFADLRQSIPLGNRRIPDREINDAISRAVLDHGGDALQKYRILPKLEPVTHDGPRVLRNIIRQANTGDESDILDASPIRIDWPQEEDAANFLSYLFDPNALIFIGDNVEPGILGRNIRTVADWIDYLTKGRKAGPFIIINPLNGAPVKKKTGEGMTFRGDGNIQDFRYCLVEFDNITREDQLRFWVAADLPVCALIDTGGKSIHGWLDLHKLADIKNHDQWDFHIKCRLYDQSLIPMGVDRACCNPARLSRLPGHFRTEKEKIQRLLWLSPEGRSVMI
jgi:hypothetical protein